MVGDEMVAARTVVVESAGESGAVCCIRVAADGIIDDPRQVVGIAAHGDLHGPLRTVARHGGGLAVGGGRIIDDVDPFAGPDETEAVLLEGVPFAAWQVGTEFRRVGRRFDFQLFAEVDGVVAEGAAFADVSRVFCPFDEILHAFFSVRQEEDVFRFGVLETDVAKAGDVAFDGAQVYAKTRLANAGEILRLAVDGGFRFVEQLHAVAEDVIRHPAGRDVAADMQVDACFHDGVNGQLPVAEQGVRRRAVVACEEFVHQGFFVKLRIPKQMRNNPCPSRHEIADRAA